MATPVPRVWHASWIWHPRLTDENNVHLLARREVALAAVPRAAAIRVTANSRYRLWLNGVEIGRGPNPSYPKWQYFDTYDVTPHLRAGVNVLAVHAYCFGPTMKSALTQDPGPGGLLLELEADGRVIATADGAWRVLQDPARQQQTEPISGHRGGFKEVCDLRQEVIGWREAGFNDSGWLPAHVLGPALGTPPWENLIPREIPPLRLEPILPRDVFFHASGCSYGGPKDVNAPDALCRDDDVCTVVAPLKPGFSPALTVDFGRNMFGFYEIEIVQSAGGMLDVAYGESLNVTDVDRVVLRSGAQTYMPFERRGGRYLVLTFSDLAGPVHIRRVRCLRQSYPVEYRGEFRCSDERLNRIWDVGRYTVQMCMHDHYEDCPWREQTLYPGDTAVSAWLSYYAFGSEDIGRKCLRQMARLQNAEGLIPSTGPAPTAPGYIPDYAAFWVLAFWNHHLHWGDAEFTRELFPNLDRCLEWYVQRSAADGLFRKPATDKCMRFVDNLSAVHYKMAGEAEDLVPEQMCICQAFRVAARLAQDIGVADRAARWTAHAEHMATAINARYWQAAINAYGAPDGSDATLPVGTITNGLAALFGIAPGDRLGAALRRVVGQATVAPVKAGYMNGYVTEAFFTQGSDAAGLDRIRDYWGGMLDRGATTFWEVFDPTTPDGTLPHWLWSLCHAFCAAPVRLLPAYAAGIRPLEPGFRRVLIAPRLCDLLWARATVPTRWGDIRVSASRAAGTHGLDVETFLPAGVAAEFALAMPDGNALSVWLNGMCVPRVADSATFRGIAPLLESVEQEPVGVRLRFAAGTEARTLRLATRATDER